MTLLLAIASLAQAGAVYLNGVRADELPEATITNATIRVDAEGNLWIEAPGYTVTVREQGDPRPPARSLPSAAVRAPQPSAPSVVSAPAPTSPVVSNPPPPAPSPSPSSGWWLVVEDAASVGHVVDVIVNGNRVYRVQSGAAQAALDLGPYVRSGSNSVVIEPRGGAPVSGTLRMYVGRATPVASARVPTLRLDVADVRYARGPSDPAVARSYTITVP
jgi:hypothetical protein